MQATIHRCSKMLVLGEKDVRRCLSMSDCIEMNRKALTSLSKRYTKDGKPSGVVPTRLALPYSSGLSTGDDEAPQDWTLFKPAAWYSPDNVLMGLKIVSVRSHNASIGKPMVPATIMLVDAQSGESHATLGGTYLTAARTAAGSAVATQLCCSQEPCRNLLLFGAGMQAECHIDALMCVLPNISSIKIVNRTRDRAESLKEKVAEQYPTLSTIETILLKDHGSVKLAVSEAHVIVACTNSPTPLWDGSWLQSNCHVIGIGSYTPDMQEVDRETVDRSNILVDTWEALQVGDLKHLDSKSNQAALLGDALWDESKCNAGKETESDSRRDCTFYKAVGTAIQDVLTASMVVEHAKELGIGTEVDMS